MPQSRPPGAPGVRACHASCRAPSSPPSAAPAPGPRTKPTLRGARGSSFFLFCRLPGATVFIYSALASPRTNPRFGRRLVNCRCGGLRVPRARTSRLRPPRPWPCGRRRGVCACAAPAGRAANAQAHPSALPVGGKKQRGRLPFRRQHYPAGYAAVYKCSYLNLNGILNQMA